jgi:hypothetical protein
VAAEVEIWKIEQWDVPAFELSNLKYINTLIVNC